jgi:hypothetical protein
MQQLASKHKLPKKLALRVFQNRTDRPAYPGTESEAEVFAGNCSPSGTGFHPFVDWQSLYSW